MNARCTTRRSLRSLAAAAALVTAFAVGAPSAPAQTTGVILGTVLNEEGQPVAGAEISVPPLPQRSISGPDGRFIFVGAPVGEHQVIVRATGFQQITVDGVQVRASQRTELRVQLAVSPVQLPGIIVDVDRVRVTDLEASASQQIVGGTELRAMPVTTLAEVVELTPGVSDGHFRGGRVGQEVYVVDGIELKNQLEASTQGFGLEFSPTSLEELGVMTGGFGAEYGSALSGVVQYVTRRGNDVRWRGNASVTTDQWAPASLMRGFTGVSLSADGPLRFLGEGTTLFADLLVQGMLDADPRARGLTCLEPDDVAQDLRIVLREYAGSAETAHLACPYSSPMLPHQQGDKVIAFARLDRPVGGTAQLTVSVLRNRLQQQLYTPEFKYNPTYQLGQRTTGTLLSASLDWATHRAGRAYQLTARGAYMRLDRHLGALDPWTFTDRFTVAGFGPSRFRFLGEDFVHRPIEEQLEVGGAVPGYLAPGGSSGSPFGPAAEGIFFTEGTPHIANWSQSDVVGGDLVGQMITASGNGIRAGGSVKLYRVQSYERLQSHLPGSSPNFARFFPATVSTFAEGSIGALSRATVTFGARLEAFRAGIRFREDRGDFLSPEIDSEWQFSFMPRVGASLPIQDGRSAFRFNFGMVAQPPDFRYFVDSSLGDSLRTDIRRQGNPSLSFERGNTYELGYRHLINENVAVEATLFRKELSNLVTGELTLASTSSRQITTGESGTVNGAEVLLRGQWPGIRVQASYGLQKAVALTVPILPGLEGDDSLAPIEIPLAFDRRHALDAAVFLGSASGALDRIWGVSATARVRSGYPIDPQSDTTIDLVKLRSPRYLPWSFLVSARATLDLPDMPGCGRCTWRVVADGRNLLGLDNVVGVRRDTGRVSPTYDTVLELIDAVPTPSEEIPKESPRYSVSADLNGDGYIDANEFRLARVGAAIDRFDPSLYMGEARQIRIGVEVAF